MEETIKVKVAPLTAEAFPALRPMPGRQGARLSQEADAGEGRVLDRTDAQAAGESAAASAGWRCIFCTTRPSFRCADRLFLTPAPRNREQVPSVGGGLRRSSRGLRRAGPGSTIDKGTWHNVVALGAECQFINVTRKNPGEGTTDPKP